MYCSMAMCEEEKEEEEGGGGRCHGQHSLGTVTTDEDPVAAAAAAATTTTAGEGSGRNSSGGREEVDADSCNTGEVAVDVVGSRLDNLPLLILLRACEYSLECSMTKLAMLSIIRFLRASCLCCEYCNASESWSALVGSVVEGRFLDRLGLVFADSLSLSFLILWMVEDVVVGASECAREEEDARCRDIAPGDRSV